MKNLLFLLLVLCMVTARAQLSPSVLEIKAADTLQAGENLRVNVFIQASDTAEIHPILPREWKILSKSVFPTGDYRFRYFYLIAPGKSVSAGDYLFRFMLPGNMDSTEEIVHVVVAPRRELRLSPLVNPAYIREGDTLQVSFLLENLGNTHEKVKLSSKGSHIFGNSEVEVQPQGSMEITTYSAVGTTKLSTWSFSTGLIADDEAGKQYHAFTSTPVYTNRIIKADPYLRLPVYAGAGLLHYNSANGPITSYQYIINGNGYLDDSSKHYLRFDFRGPDQLLFPAIGSYDNYTIHYKRKGKLELELGDYQNSVSNLLEYSRYGRGFKAIFQREKQEYHAFYHHARFFPGQRASFGAQLVHHFKPGVRVHASVMNKEILEKSAWVNATLGSVNFFHLDQRLKINAELASSLSRLGTSAGFSSQVSFVTNKWAVNSNLLFSGKHFYGFYSNGRQLAHSLYYNINSKASVGVSSNVSRINPGFDLDEFKVSPYSSNLIFFTTYRISNKQSLALNHTRQESEDRRQPSSFHYKESFNDLTHTLNFTWFQSQTQLRVGSAQNLLAEADVVSSRLGYSIMTQPSVRVHKELWLGGFFQYQHTNKFSSQNILEDLYFYGADVRGAISERINFSFSFRNNFAPDELFERRSFLDAYLNWEYRNNKVEFRAGKTYLPGVTASNQNTLFLSLKFTRRLNIPVRKNKEIGHLKGILKQDNNLPVSNQVIQLGQYRTVTDEQGNFYFSNLKPDTYFISLPTDALVPGLTMRESGVQAVQLVKDSVAFVEVELVKTGGIQGNIAFENFETPLIGNLREEKAPQALIKLSNEKVQLMTLSNKDGSYSFKDIRPGEYQLQVSLINETSGMELIEQERTVSVKSEQLLNEYFLVRNVKRKVKFAEQEFRLSSNK